MCVEKQPAYLKAAAVIRLPRCWGKRSPTKPAVRGICEARRELNVVTDRNALALPQKVSAKEAAAYGLYFAKQTFYGRLFESISKLKGNLPGASHRQYRRRRNGETTETGQRSWESGPSGSP